MWLSILPSAPITSMGCQCHPVLMSELLYQSNLHLIHQSNGRKCCVFSLHTSPHCHWHNGHSLLLCIQRQKREWGALSVESKISREETHLWNYTPAMSLWSMAHLKGLLKAQSNVVGLEAGDHTSCMYMLYWHAAAIGITSSHTQGQGSNQEAVRVVHCWKGLSLNSHTHQ